jgi:DNA-directed RNA polymerase subunit L
MDIKTIHYTKREKLTSSKLELKFTGFNHVIVNTLRRISMDLIPTYAFCPETITISTNTSIAFNNDYLKLRFSQLPIFNVNLDLFELPDKFWRNIDYSNNTREKHPSEQNIDIYINSVNLTGDIVNITTNDIICQLENVDFKMYDEKYPILLIKLKPTEKINCHLHAVLGIGERNAIWSASSNSYYDITDDSINLSVESNSHLSEFDILIKSCKLTIKKINDIKNKFKEIKSNKTIIELDNEDHTFGNLINYFLQSNRKIIFSGVFKPDLLQKSISLKIESKTSLSEPLNEVFDEIISTFTKIQSLLEKLEKKK